MRPRVAQETWLDMLQAGSQHMLDRSSIRDQTPGGWNWITFATSSRSWTVSGDATPQHGVLHECFEGRGRLQRL